MAKKPMSVPRRRTDAKSRRVTGERTATTYRLEPRFQRGLSLLGQVRRVPLNRMVNEAVGEYLEARTAELEADLDAILGRVHAYRSEDPDFEAAVATFADGEAAAGGSDPVEGDEAPAAGSAQRLVRDLIRG